MEVREADGQSLALRVSMLSHLAPRLTHSTVEALQTLLENRIWTTLNLGHTYHFSTRHSCCMM